MVVPWWCRGGVPTPRVPRRRLVGVRICFTHVDNYAHGLIIAERALKPGSKALGGFYIVTDGESHPYREGYLYLWDAMEEAGLAMGFSAQP